MCAQVQRCPAAIALMLSVACVRGGGMLPTPSATSRPVHVGHAGVGHVASLRLRGGSADGVGDSNCSGRRPEKEKVCVVGSGNWGSAIARVVASNSPALPNVCDEVSMWVYEEEVNGRNLSHIINTEHENTKYLPGVKLPPNLVAEPDLERAVSEASVLVWVLPHQFLSRLLPRVKAVMRKDAISVSLIKGMAAGQDGTLQLVSSHIAQGLGVSEVAVLMGANVADQVARDELCEATLGVSHPSLTPVLLPLFDRACFRVRAVSDVAGVEVCGALKNVVALAAGFADGLGLGSNTKAALMRIGMAEISKFALRFYPCVDKETMWESCGIADLITTCSDGRNRRCAESFAASTSAQTQMSSQEAAETWHSIETQLLNGQKLQGPQTAEHVHTMLSNQGAAQEFPLLETIYAISGTKSQK